MVDILETTLRRDWRSGDQHWLTYPVNAFGDIKEAPRQLMTDASKSRTIETLWPPLNGQEFGMAGW